MKLAILFTVLQSINCFDFVVDKFKEIVDFETDPCDNFYRHVCPINDNVKDLVYDLFTQFFDQVLANQTHLLDDFTFRQDLIELSDRYGTNQKHFNAALASEISEVYTTLCIKGEDSTEFFKHLMSVVPTGDCGTNCFLYIKNDPNCKRAALHIKNRILTSNMFKVRHFDDALGEIANLEKTVKIINAHIDGNVRNGIHQTEEMLEDMKQVAKKWIKETPWVVNNNLTESIISAVEPVTLASDYNSILKGALGELSKIELFYANCKKYYRTEEASVVCAMHIIRSIDTNSPRNTFSSGKAFIAFPNIEFGFLFYYVAQHSKEMASKLGFTGAAVGHELSHILIKSTPEDYLTYFSQKSLNCIQNQFASTCATFKEESCDTADYQVDENGADVLGLQLAYDLLETYYKDDLKAIYKPLNITNQQLFFYATALSFCKGVIGKTKMDSPTRMNVHSPSYIRVNAYVSQHPGFREAFNCSKNSRMIKSTLDQCVIYGSGAPQVKRH